MADPVSSIWPKPLADFLTSDRSRPRHQTRRHPLRHQRLHWHASQRGAQVGQEIRFRRGNRLRPGRADRDIELHGAAQQHPRETIPTRWSTSATRQTTSLSCAMFRTAASSFKFLFCIYPGTENELLEKKSRQRRSITCSPLACDVVADARPTTNFRHAAEGIQRSLAQEIWRYARGIRLPFRGRLYHRTGAGKGARETGR